TTGYATPEAPGAEQDGTESEVCSLGALLFELIHEHSGTLEASGEDAGLQGDLEAIITKALNADPRQRFSTVRELGDALRPLAAGRQAWSPRVAPRPPVGEMPTLWQATRLVLIVFAALAMVGLLAQYLHPAH
ncbi:MAG: hypothetical protein KGJ86_12345, partial [Chloroflexota bacterium]|nr:hypothetical protein [Chloroflexota bacterium]